MSGPPVWLWWALAVSLSAVPVCLIVAITSALIDRRTPEGPPRE